jgi:hypothetical protein
MIVIRFDSEIGKRVTDSGTAWVYEKLEFWREVLYGKNYAAHHPNVDFNFSFVVCVSFESCKEFGKLSCWPKEVLLSLTEVVNMADVPNIRDLLLQHIFKFRVSAKQINSRCKCQFRSVGCHCWPERVPKF